MPATTGMKGAGYYDQHSTAQQASLQLVIDWIEDAIRSLPLPPVPQAMTFLDLGSSEGRNALRAMSAVVDAVLRRRGEQIIQTIYSDLPGNNFNRLFVNLDEARNTGQIPSCVYPSAVAGSFYDSLVPPNSVHFAMAFNAILWLDRLPKSPIPDFVVYRRPHPPLPGLQVSPETAAAFSQKAGQDLVRFLEKRAQELVKGGKLLLVTPGDTEAQRIADGLYDALNDACLDLIAAGRLQRERYERFTMPIYFRTLAEMLAPLERESSPIKGNFTVDRAETLEVPTPFFIAFDQSRDAAKLAEDYTGFLRAFSEPVARSALSGNESDVGIIEELYARIRQRIQSDPERYRFRYFVAATLFTHC
jgi:hypothetical protein